MKYLITLTLLPFLLVWRGFVLTILWLWFAVPLGMPELTVPYAIGLSLIVSFMVGLKESTKTEAEQLLTIMVHPVAALAIGWVVTKFI